MLLIGPVIVPGALRQVDETTRYVGIQTRREEEIIADHELIVEIVSARVVLVVEQQRSKRRNAGAMRFFQSGVEKRQQLVTEVQIPANDVFVVLAEAPGLLIVTID